MVEIEHKVRRGPLNGLRVIELGGIGPIHFAGMLLSDLGAEVIRIDRPDYVSRSAEFPIDAAFVGLDHLGRSRRRAAIDIKTGAGAELVLSLAETADVLVESYRPGVVERLGVGPVDCRARNDRLVYGRISGWGRTGPLASAPGHDINYIALAGVLDKIGWAGGPPVAPVGHIADYGGGGMLLVVGVLAALWERESSGLGQVVDASALEGSVLMNSLVRFLAYRGEMSGPRGTNSLDGGSHFMRAYQTSDGKWISVGAVESKFHAELLRRVGIDDVDPAIQFDSSRWPELSQRLAEIFVTASRDEWEKRLSGVDVCFAPVLSPGEAPRHPHNVAEGTFVEVGGEMQAAPVPHFDRTPLKVPSPAHAPGTDTRLILAEIGISEDVIDELLANGVVAEPELEPAERS